MPAENKKKSMTDICHEIAESLIKKYNFRSIGGKDDEIYIYKNGIYEKAGRDYIRVEVEKKLSALCKTHYVNEVVNKIVRKTLTERSNMGCNDPNLVCLENGVLDVGKLVLYPHSSEYRFMSKLPVAYDAGARCPLIENFIFEVCYEADINTVQEWIGYLLWKNYFVKKGVIIVGEGDTGKTTFLNLMGKFVGEENISGVSLQKLSGDKFAGAHLYNKHANVYDDLSSGDIVDVGAFKIATGGGYITGEYKFGDQFQFKNFAKLMFATNRIPGVKVDDDDLAYYKRWIVFRFENVFDDNNKQTNKNLIVKLTSDEEMSGLLNWALVGLKRLLKNGMFSDNKSIDEIKLMMQRHENDLAKFVQDCCLRGDEMDWLSKQEFYGHYKEYCILNGLPLLTIEKVGRDIIKYCEWIVDSREGQKTGWRFVKIVENKPVFSEFTYEQ